MKTHDTTTTAAAQPENAPISDSFKVSDALYPLADYMARHEYESLGVNNYRNVRAVPTGEKRNPKSGEWYLSGAIIEAYKAPNDLSTPFHIARLVKIESDARPLKIWQKVEGGRRITVSVWPDRKIRTGYYEKDFWSTLKREGLSLTDAEWTASPGEEWQDITEIGGVAVCD